MSWIRYARSIYYAKISSQIQSSIYNTLSNNKELLFSLYVVKHVMIICYKLFDEQIL